MCGSMCNGGPCVVGCAVGTMYVTYGAASTCTCIMFERLLEVHNVESLFLPYRILVLLILQVPMPLLLVGLLTLVPLPLVGPHTLPLVPLPLVGPLTLPLVPLPLVGPLTLPLVPLPLAGHTLLVPTPLEPIPLLTNLNLDLPNLALPHLDRLW